MGKDVIIACDFSSAEKVYSFLDKFGEKRPFLKLGMELFYKEGSQMVKELKNRGHKIFLDLKLHDIPNTVRKAMFNIGAMDVDITNVHAAGGIRMMQEARLGLAEGAESKGYQPAQLIAVTQLTSTDQEMLETELLIKEPIADVVKKYAENAKKAGLDGVVCSPLEASIMRLLDLISVTPGIGLLGDSVNDQKRVSTPEGAKNMGSTYIVVGRSITAADNPLEAYERCVAEFCD